LSDDGGVIGLVRRILRQFGSGFRETITIDMSGLASWNLTGDDQSPTETQENQSANYDDPHAEDHWPLCSASFGCNFA
jgi:hypothetical protein